MRDITHSVLDQLSGIVVNVFAAIMDHLLFPRQPHPLEEQLSARVKGQFALIRGQQDKVSYLTGVIQAQSQDIRERDRLIIQKDEETKTLVETIRSLELRLQTATSRSRRWR